MSYYSTYRWCAVPKCKNTSIKTRDKLWFQVPNDVNMRKTWFEVAGRDLKLIHTKSRLYFCEDHFDLEHDMENYMKYKVMGSLKRIRTKPNCIPSRFDCNRKHKSALNQCGLAEAKRLSISKDSVPDHIEEYITKAPPLCIECEDDIKEEPPSPPEPDPVRLCSRCSVAISGFMFVCVDCDVRECNQCITLDVNHEEHYVLRVPHGRPESEMELVLIKIREALPLNERLPSLNATRDTRRVPDMNQGPPDSRQVPDTIQVLDSVQGTAQEAEDQESGDDGDEPEKVQYEVVKMEIKTEEEEDPLSFEAGECAMMAYPSTQEEVPSQLPPCVTSSTSIHHQDPEEDEDTLSAESPSESELQDFETRTPCTVKPRIQNWTKEANKHLVRCYFRTVRTENRKSQIYSKIEKAFTAAYPHMGVTSSDLEKQHILICNEKLLTDEEMKEIQIEIESDNIRINTDAVLNRVIGSSGLRGKGKRLELSKVTSDGVYR